MFDLEKAIAEWRQSLIAGGVESAEVVDELESHLREDIEEQMTAGMDAERAFKAAVQRIGEGQILKSEFEKAAPCSPASRKITLPGAFIILAVFVALVNTWTLIIYEMSPVEKIMGFTAVWLTAFYTGSLPYLYRYWSGIHRSGVERILKIVCLAVAVWPLCALLAVKLSGIELGIMVDTVVWCVYAALIFTVAAGVLIYPTLGIDADFGFTPSLSGFGPLSLEAIEVAQQEATLLNHDFIGTEHLLLGLLRSSDKGVVPTVLRRAGLNGDLIREEIERIIGRGATQNAKASIPYTPRARRALFLATDRARTLRRAQAEPEDILLGLLLEGSGAAAIVLKNFDVDVDTLTKQIEEERS